MAQFQAPPRLYRVGSNLWSQAPKARKSSEASAAAARLEPAAAMNTMQQATASAPSMDAACTQHAHTEPSGSPQCAGPTKDPLAFWTPPAFPNEPAAQQPPDPSAPSTISTVKALGEPLVATAPHIPDKHDPLAACTRESTANGPELRPCAQDRFEADSADRHADWHAEQHDGASSSAAVHAAADKPSDQEGPNGVPCAMHALCHAHL
jgi:hypothetical protein